MEEKDLVFYWFSLLLKVLQNLVGRGKRFRILLIFLLLGVLRNLVDGEKKSEFQRLFFVIKSFAEFTKLPILIVF